MKELQKKSDLQEVDFLDTLSNFLAVSVNLSRAKENYRRAQAELTIAEFDYDIEMDSYNEKLPDFITNRRAFLVDRIGQ